ncbi:MULTISPECIES: DUF3102 domain-containing protein [unclassified Nostoc]|uniref:DUF3102 domain-containing protein n=1 Tax=unclassified Nostoc TaxID=2593658 RepID=UPI002ADAE9AE|nr:DUF3102 domain-containing protein [Nostoc sp. DedQUE02]
METSNIESVTFPIEAKVISTEPEVTLKADSVLKSKSDFKTQQQKQERLAALAQDTRCRLKRSAMDIYCIGLNLLEAQNIIEHGEFLPWLRQEFGMGKTSAYEFMNIAKAFESKFPIIGNLINNITPTALCKLAAPSTSQAARDEAIDILEAGEVVDADVAKKLINKYKTLKKAKKQQQKVSSTSQQSDLNKVEVSQIEQIANDSIPLFFAPQKDELQKLIVERDTYKTKLEVLQITNEQLQADITKLRSKLNLLQNINKTK